jgi:hypothetical protein
VTKSTYLLAQEAIAQLKGAVYELLEKNPKGISNAEVGRRLGIYQGHVGHEGHISRTVLGMLENEEVAEQDPETKLWTIRKQPARTTLKKTSD